MGGTYSGDNSMKKHCHPGNCFEGSHVCLLEETNEAYRKLWCEGVSNDRVKVDSPQVAPAVQKCKHLGELTGERITEMCKSCGGVERPVEFKLFSCAIYGKCLPGKQVAGIASCVNCPSKEI